MLPNLAQMGKQVSELIYTRGMSLNGVMIREPDDGSVV